MSPLQGPTAEMLAFTALFVLGCLAFLRPWNAGRLLRLDLQAVDLLLIRIEREDGAGQDVRRLRERIGVIRSDPPHAYRVRPTAYQQLARRHPDLVAAANELDQAVKAFRRSARPFPWVVRGDWRGDAFTPPDVPPSPPMPGPAPVRRDPTRV